MKINWLEVLKTIGEGIVFTLLIGSLIWLWIIAELNPEIFDNVYQWLVGIDP